MVSNKQPKIDGNLHLSDSKLLQLFQAYRFKNILQVFSIFSVLTVLIFHYKYGTGIIVIRNGKFLKYNDFIGKKPSHAFTLNPITTLVRSGCAVAIEPDIRSWVALHQIIFILYFLSQSCQVILYQSTQLLLKIILN